MYFKRLRDMREDHDMKQVEIADYLGIDKGNSHRALDDAITCMELFKKCLEKK